MFAELYCIKDYRRIFVGETIICSSTQIPFRYFNYDILYPDNFLDVYYLNTRFFFLI